MKCRSPSPVEGSALPTPPHSPDDGTVVHKSAVATNMLDSLCSFYQQERYWVHHTRAALELALSKGIDAPALICGADANSAGTASPASSTSTLCDSPMQNPVFVKPDPDAENTTLLLTTPPLLEDSADARASRWLRRKNKMRLRLDGIDSHPHRNKGKNNIKKVRPHKAPPNEPGARLLEMFSELVDARMESCQRISRMVQESAARQQQLLLC